MTTANASGFSLLGLAMAALPTVFPAYFPINSLDGSNTSALWLTVMGTFQVAFGSYVLVRNEVVPFAVRITAKLAVLRAAPRQALPAMLLRPLRNGLLEASGERRDQRLAA